MYMYDQHNKQRVHALKSCSSLAVGLFKKFLSSIFYSEVFSLEGESILKNIFAYQKMFS